MSASRVPRFRRHTNADRKTARWDGAPAPPGKFIPYGRGVALGANIYGHLPSIPPDLLSGRTAYPAIVTMHGIQAPSRQYASYMNESNSLSMQLLLKLSAHCPVDLCDLPASLRSFPFLPCTLQKSAVNCVNLAPQEDESASSCGGRRWVSNSRIAKTISVVWFPSQSIPLPLLIRALRPAIPSSISFPN